jgi:predicted GIY-YIG superfamily endonuclease
MKRQVLGFESIWFDVARMAMSTQRLYVLELEDGKYYVGTTNNLQRRFQEHVDGAGSVWTRRYVPIAIERSVAVEGPLHEDRVTKELMLKHGIENVRGGSYCSIELEDGQLQSLTTELRSATGVCFQCGRSGHFAADCRFKVVGRKRGPEKEKTSAKRSKTTEKRNEGCFRCGRRGHFANECYARTDMDGDPLSDSSSDSSSDSYEGYDSC